MNSIKIVAVILLLQLLTACSGGDSRSENVPEIPDSTNVETSPDSSDDTSAGAGTDTSSGDDAPDLPESHFNYANITLPAHYLNNGFEGQVGFQEAAIVADNTPSDNPITDAGATLGRVLFYDRKLSQNGEVACASCHVQEHGFSDPEKHSLGFDGGLTRRHSMGLSNARFFSTGRFFWDERASTLEEQVLMPFQDPVEMGLTLAELEEKVAAQSYYPALFEDAFGDAEISSSRIARALAQFVRSIVNTNSRYDQARSEVNTPAADFPGFTAQENLGKSLFFLPRDVGNGEVISCAVCHVSEAFIGPINVPGNATTNSTSNGLDVASTDDGGIFETTGNMADIGKFKVPSLANVGVTQPYMHDGRFATLEEVVEFYSSGIQAHPNLSRPLLGANGQVNQFNFNEEEKSAMVAFLHTLTDVDLLTDPKYSDPFR